MISASKTTFGHNNLKILRLKVIKNLTNLHKKFIRICVGSFVNFNPVAPESIIQIPESLWISDKFFRGRHVVMTNCVDDIWNERRNSFQKLSEPTNIIHCSCQMYLKHFKRSSTTKFFN